MAGTVYRQSDFGRCARKMDWPGNLRDIALSQRDGTRERDEGWRAAIVDVRQVIRNAYCSSWQPQLDFDQGGRRVRVSYFCTRQLRQEFSGACHAVRYRNRPKNQDETHRRDCRKARHPGRGHGAVRPLQGESIARLHQYPEEQAGRETDSRDRHQSHAGGRRQDHHHCRAGRCLEPDRQESDHLPARTIAGSGVRHEGRGGRRRLRSGRSHGGYTCISPATSAPSRSPTTCSLHSSTTTSTTATNLRSTCAESPGSAWWT